MALPTNWGLQASPSWGGFNLDQFNGAGNYAAMNAYGQPAATAPSPVAAAATPALNTPGGIGSMQSSLGMNIPTFQLGVQGLSTLAGLYTGLKSLGLAQDQFNFTKGMAEKNYNNSVSNYNTSLEDRARSRAAVEGQSSAQMNDYIAKNRLS